MALNVGVPISGAPSLASDVDRDSWTRLFHEQSVSPLSHNLDASAHGVLLMGFGLMAGDSVCVEMVVGCKDGTYFEEIKVSDECGSCSCRSLCLTSCNNILFVPYPIRVRLRYTGSRLGLFNVFAAEVPAAWLPVLRGGYAPAQPPAVGRLQC